MLLYVLYCVWSNFTSSCSKLDTTQGRKTFHVYKLFNDRAIISEDVENIHGLKTFLLLSTELIFNPLSRTKVNFFMSFNWFSPLIISSCSLPYRVWLVATAIMQSNPCRNSSMREILWMKTSSSSGWACDWDSNSRKVLEKNKTLWYFRYRQWKWKIILSFHFTLFSLSLYSLNPRQSFCVNNLFLAHFSIIYLSTKKKEAKTRNESINPIKWMNGWTFLCWIFFSISSNFYV